MKAEWTVANHPEVSGLEACAAKALETLRLSLGPTVLVKVGEWTADILVRNSTCDDRLVVGVQDSGFGEWCRTCKMPTTAEEMARALLFALRRGVDLRRGAYVAAAEALAEEMPGKDGAA